VKLAETIGRLIGRVEVVLAGAEGSLRAAEEALAAGDAMRARAEAHALLGRVPHSPIGLALLADACEMAGLDAELALALEDLATRVGSRADVWLRLGRAREATKAPREDVRDAFVRALAVAEPGSDVRRETLLALADLDLAQSDGARAELWLDRLVDDKSGDVQLRRGEARLAQNDWAGASRILEGLDAPATDGRAALARGRALAAAGDARAFTSLLRAMVLETEGASEALSSAVAYLPSDEPTRAKIRAVVEAQGEAKLTRWRAAFARAEGRRDEARAALRDALAAGDLTAARPLLESALDDQDPEALVVALAALPADDRDDVVADARRLPSAEAPQDAGAVAGALDRLASISNERVLPWANAIRARLARTWIPEAPGIAEWNALLERLDQHARALHDLEALARIAEIAVDRTRPVRVAIVGEFNAGKSTFINALIGAEIAPMGVLPTTATLHHLRYAPDPIARVLFAAGHTPPERIVPVGELRATLKAVEGQPIRRVEILLPLASLTRVEILDTPGFNAPDASHAKTARSAFEEADAVIWLLDAAQAMKQSERTVLEEARAAKIPVQMLVNKADRLRDGDLEKVMAQVRASLEEIGVASWTPPIALSARLALAGKLGDAAALEASKWAMVQELLDAQLVARSGELKERALRRRAAQVVGRLGARAARRADEERAAAEVRKARARERAQIAARLDAQIDDLGAKLAAGLSKAASEWSHDLGVIATGRDRSTVARDVALQRYRVERALARLAPPLASGLAALVQGGATAEVDVAPMVRALVRSYAACTQGPPDEAALIALSRSAIASLVERLAARGLSSGAERGAERAGAEATETGRMAELASLAEALA
jgi:small GTP-binding protein